MTYGAAARSCLGAVAVAAAMTMAGCGSDASLNINNNAQCGGGSGPQIRGVVRMPNGRVAADAGLSERLAALVVAPVDALTGSVSPVGKGVTVELVEFRPEDVGGQEPGSVGRTTTNSKGEFCVGLVRGTTVDVCRYMLRVGDREDGTRTRAFVSASDSAIDVDFVSEATVQVILNGIPPADLCDFAPDEIGEIHDAVRDVPGSVTGATVAEVNALATTLATNDANVQALVSAAGNLPPATATNVPGVPTATFTRQPSATPVLPSATATLRGPTGSPTSRPTRTPNGPTATLSPTRTAVPTRTNTPGGATVTATVPAATATATRAATTAAPTATATVAGPTPTATRTVPAATPTATRTVGPATPTFTATTVPVGLGDRVFTIREDSGAPAPDPRTGFFSSGLSGFSVSERFTAGPIVITADAPNANGVAQLRLKQDAYFKVYIKLGATILCVKWVAQGSRGSIDCNGGTAYGVTLTEAAGNTPPGVPVTSVGSDSGPGAANLFVRQVISEIHNQCPTGGGTCTVSGTPCVDSNDCIPTNINDSKACDATTVFDNTGLDVVYTTANFLGTKGNRTFNKNGESLSCDMWTTTDGPGMLVTGLLAVDERAGGTSANGIRVADR